MSEPAPAEGTFEAHVRRTLADLAASVDLSYEELTRSWPKRPEPSRFARGMRAYARCQEGCRDRAAGDPECRDACRRAQVALSGRRPVPPEAGAVPAGTLVAGLADQLLDCGPAAVVRAHVDLAAKGMEHPLQAADGDVVDLAALQGGELSPGDAGLLGKARERNPAGKPAGTDGGAEFEEVEAHVG